MFDGQAIAGEYPFGNQPPTELMGWLGPEEEKRSMAQLEELGLTTSLADVLPLVATDEPPGPPVWQLAEKFFGGQQMPTPRQETGDCTCVAEKVEKQFRQIVQIVEQYREEKYRPVFAPFTYYTARQKVLQGRIRGAGATGAAVAEAVNRYGTLFEDDDGVPPYSGRIADLWGNGGGGVERFEPVAVDNPVRKVVRLKTRGRDPLGDPGTPLGLDRFISRLSDAAGQLPRLSRVCPAGDVDAPDDAPGVDGRPLRGCVSRQPMGSERPRPAAQRRMAGWRVESGRGPGTRTTGRVCGGLLLLGL